MRDAIKREVTAASINPGKFYIGLLILTESLVLYFFIPQFILIPAKSDVIGGFLLNDSPNLKYILFWLLFLGLVICLLPIQLRIMNKIKKSGSRVDFGNRHDQVPDTSTVGNFESVYRIVGALTAFIVVGKFLILLLHNLQTNRKLEEFPLNAAQDLMVMVIVSVIGILIVNYKVKQKIPFSFSSKFLIYRVQSYLPIIVVLCISLAAIRALRKNDLNLHLPNVYGLTLITVVLVALFVRRTLGKESTDHETLINLFGFPAVIALFLAQIPGTVTAASVDPFEAYSFSNVFSWLDYSYLPWRDLLFNHGVYEDFLRPLFGTFLFGQTVWGMQTGILLIVVPLEFLFIYWGLTRIFRGSNAIAPIVSLFGLLIGFFPAVAPSTDNRLLIAAQTLPRILPLILFLVIYSATFKSHLLKRFMLGAALAIAILFAPDGMYLVVSFLIVSAFNDILLMRIARGRETLEKRVIQFPNLINATSIVIICGFILLALLYSMNITSDFIQSFSQNSSGFLFQAGASFSWTSGFPYLFTVLFCVAIISLVLYRASDGLVNGHEKNGDLTLILIPTLIAIALFTKFLLWPDWHILQVLAALTVPMYWLLISQFKLMESGNRAAFGIVLVFPISFLLTQLPQQLQIESALTPNYSNSIRLERVGPADEEVMIRSEKMKNLRLAANKFTEKKHPLVLDYTVTPTDVYSFSSFKPVSNLLFVITSFSNKSQQHYVDKLIQNPPDLVLWRGEIGLFNRALPGETYLRTYRIAEYVLRNYRPSGMFGGYILLTPKEVTKSGYSQEIELAALAMGAQNCTWGNALERFKYPFSPESESSSLKATPTTVVKVSIATYPENKYKVRAFGKNEALMFTIANTGRLPEVDGKEILLPTGLANEIEYFEVNDERIPYSFRNSSKVVIKDLVIKVNEHSDPSKKFSTVNSVGEFRGISIPNDQVEGSYSIKRISNIGESTFRINGISNQKEIRIPLANCPSFGRYTLNDSRYDQVLLMSAPRNSLGNGITLLR
jgi:hypothetical protein